MHVRKIGEKYYDMMEKGYRPLNEHAFARFKNLPFAKSLKKYLDEYQPDLIICTQVYCVHIMDIVKSKGWTDAVLMGVDLSLIHIFNAKLADKFTYLCNTWVILYFKGTRCV